MAGEEVVGSIVGFLKLNADDFHREITKALAEIKVLSSTDAKVKVEATGVRSTERDLLKVAGAAKVVDGNVSRMGKSFSSGGMSSGPLIVGGIAAGMALLGPITGAATAALGGFVGVAGTAALAFVGFRDEIQKGTAVGQYLQGELDGIKGAFEDLGTTAASAMSGDVLTALGDVRAFLPSLDGDVEALAGHLGRAFRVSTGGLLTGLHNMMPLLQDGGRYAEVLAQKFADFTESQDFKDFIAYAQRELPTVIDSVVALSGAVVAMGKAFAPVGDDLIKSIGTLSKGFNLLADVAGPVLKVGFWSPFKTGADDAATGLKGAAAAVDDHTSALVSLQAVQSPLAASLGITNEALKTATDEQRTTADSAASATQQMQLQGNAAGLLKQALDSLNGKTLDVASAQTASASASLRAISALKDHTKGENDYGKSLSLNTDKGVAARQALEAKARADQQAAEAVAQATGSTQKGTASLAENKAALEKSLKAQGLLTGKVQAYIDKIYQVPKKVPPTVLEVQTAHALSSITAFQKAIDALHGKSVTASVHYAYSGRLPGVGASTGGFSTHGGSTFDSGAMGGLISDGIKRYAGGGLLTGPGTGTSDSIFAAIAGTKEMIRVANGEFISTAMSQRRNRAALEAGNRGATLAVEGTGGGGDTYNIHIHGVTEPGALAREIARQTEMKGV